MPTSRGAQGRSLDVRERWRLPAALLLVGLVAALSLGIMAVSAQTGPSFRFGNVSTSDPDSILLDGKNWADASANLAAHSDGGLVAIPGSTRANASFTMTGTSVTVDDATTTMVFRGRSSDQLSLFVGPGVETDVLVILSWDGPSDTSPDIGVTYLSTGATLGAVLGLDPDSFLGALTVPNFATTFGRTDGDPNGTGHFSRSGNLPAAAQDYYAEIYGSTPGQITPLKLVGTGLQATATVDVGDLGSVAGDVFPYDPNSPLVLEGNLGVGLDDSFDLEFSNWNLSATLPVQPLPDIIPSFIELEDASQRWTLGIGYDSSTDLTKLSASVNAKTELFDSTTSFVLSASIGAGSGPAPADPPDPTTTTTDPSSTTTSDPSSTTTSDPSSTTTSDPSSTTTDPSTTSTTGQSTTSTTVPSTTSTTAPSTTSTTAPSSTSTTDPSTTTTSSSSTSTTQPPNFDPRRVDVTISAALNTDWVPPTGFDFIQLTNLSIDGTFSEQRNVAGQITTTFSGGIKGSATIAGKVFSVQTKGELKRASGNTQASGSFRLLFDDELAVGEVLDAIGVDTGSIPSVVTDPSIGPVSLDVSYKNGTAELILTGEMSAYQLPTGGEIAARFLLRLDSNLDFMLGLRPASDPALRLSALLPSGMTVPAPIDFVLADDSSGFGFVLASSAFNKSTADMSPLVAQFFRPLAGKDIDDATPFDVEIPGPSLTVMASFKLPDEMTNLVETLGVQPRVFATGSLPLDPAGSLDMKVGLRARGDILPDWIKQVQLSFTVSASLLQPEVSIGVEGLIDFRFRSGLPQDAVDAIGGTVPVTPSVPVPEGTLCPNGTLASKSGTSLSDIEFYCYDELRVVVGADLVVAAVPPSIKLELRGALQTVNPSAVWNPFGLEWIALDNAQLILDIGVTESGITVGFGAEGTIKIGSNDLTGALSADVSVIPGSPPSVSVKFRAIRLASGAGLSMSDLVSLANTVADQELVDPNNLGMPNFAVRNVELSFSPLGDAALCVPQGLVAAGDLYLNPRNDPPIRDLSCNNGVRPPELPEEDCGANFDKGCIMGADMTFSLTGITGDGDLAPFVIGPIHVGEAPPGSLNPNPADGMSVDFALTLGQQKFVISAAGYIENPANPGAGPLLEGELFVSLKPLTVQVFGSAEVFGQRALLDTTANIDIFSGGSPELSIYALLAVDGAQVGKPAWSQLVAGEVEQPLEIIAGTAAVAGYLLDELDRTGDPIHVLFAAPEAIEATDVSLPSWLDSFIDAYESDPVQTMADALNLSRNEIADLALNGSPSVDVPGVPGLYVDVEICAFGECWTAEKCLGETVDGDCWTTPPFTVPGVSGICSELPSAVRDPSTNRCTQQRLVSQLLIPLFEDSIDTVIAPFVDQPIDFELRQLAEISEGILNGDIPVLELRCAEFLFEVNSNSQQVAIATQATILAREFGFETDFDFSDPEGSARDMLPQLITSWLDPGSISCGERGSPELDQLIANIPPVQRPYLTAVLQMNDNLVIEGGAIAGRVVANQGLDSGWVARLEARTADGTLVPELSQDLVFASGVTERSFAFEAWDDLPVGTPRDSFEFTVTAVGVEDADLPDELCCELDRERVTVSNSRPRIVDLDVSDDPVEGSPVTLTWDIADRGDEERWPITIDWGDGTIFGTNITDPVGVSASHTYLDDGSYVVTVTQYDDDTGRSKASVVVDVANLTPSVARVSGLGREGDVARVAIGIDDPGVLDAQTVAVDFGDGSPIQEYYWEPSFGSSLVVEHVYLDKPGVSPELFGIPTDIYDVTVTATDDGGLTSEPFQGEVRVLNQAPEITELTLKLDASLFATATGRVTDRGVNDTHTVSVNFIDGEPFVDVPLEPDGTFLATFQFPFPNEWVVSAFATDDDGTVGNIILDEDTGDGEGDLAIAVQARPTAVFENGDRDVTYTLTFSNVGNLPISVRSAVDDLFGDVCVDEIDQWVRDLVLIEPGDSDECEYVGTVDGPVDTTVTNTVTASAIAQSSDPQIRTASTSVEIVPDGTETADVEVVLEAASDTVVPPGRLVTYRADIENVGSGEFTIDAISVPRVDDLCPSLIGATVQAATVVSCEFEAPVGGAVDAVIERTITVEVSNRVGADTASASDSVTVVPADGPPELLIFVSPQPQRVLSGETVSYTIDVRNVGPSSFTIDSISDGEGSFCDPGIIGQVVERQEIVQCQILDEPFGDPGDTVVKTVEITVSSALGTDTQTADGAVEIGDGPRLALDPIEVGEAGIPVTLSGNFTVAAAGAAQLSVDWGDGEPNQFIPSERVGDEGTFTIDHVYDAAGVYDLTVILTDVDGLTTRKPAVATIRAANELPVLELVDPGQQIVDVGFELTGTFTDPNDDDTHTAVVDWGDGTDPTEALIAQGQGSGSLVAQHTYTEAGSYDVTVTLTDDRGFPDSETITVEVTLGTATIAGTVTRPDDTPVAGVQVDLFETNADGTRGAYLGSMATDDEGRYQFTVVEGCYILTFIAPDGDFFGGGRWYQAVVCVEIGDVVSDLDAVLDGAPNAILQGLVTFADGSPTSNVSIDLFKQAPDGGRSQWVGSVSTDAEGGYSFEVAADCYILTFIAPDGELFDGSRWFQPSVCVSAGEVVDDLDAVLDGMADASLGGTITRTDGSVVEGVVVDLYTVLADGSRGGFLGDAGSGSDGRFGFGVTEGCYWLVYVAPVGETWVNGSPYTETFRCVVAGEVIDDLDAVLEP